MNSETGFQEEPSRILVVDDNPANLFTMEKVLKKLDAEVFTAKSGKDALALLLRKDFALALVDVKMPDMDGFELAELMRGNASTQHIPIIFITAFGKEQQFVFKGYESGESIIF